MNLSSLSLNNFSNIFENCDNRDMGLQFENRLQSPALNRGITFATFMLSGNTPHSNDFEHT